MNPIAMLTPMQAWAVGRKLAGDTHAEAARRIGRTPEAIKKRVSRARKRLLRKMSKQQRERYLAALTTPDQPLKLKRIKLKLGRAK